MGKMHKVIVLGNTLVLAGIKTSVGLDKSCEMIACALETSLPELAALQPDALIFELDSVPGEFLYSLSRELPRLPKQPPLLLIGIDPETNRARFWSCQDANEVTAHDLTRAIHHTGKTGPLKEPRRRKGQNEGVE